MQTQINFINRMQSIVDHVTSNYETHDYSEYAKYICEIEDATTLDEYITIYTKFTNEVYRVKNNFKKVSK